MGDSWDSLHAFTHKSLGLPFWGRIVLRLEGKLLIGFERTPLLILFGELAKLIGILAHSMDLVDHISANWPRKWTNILFGCSQYMILIQFIVIPFDLTVDTHWWLDNIQPNHQKFFNDWMMLLFGHIVKHITKCREFVNYSLRHWHYMFICNDRFNDWKKLLVHI